VTKLRAIALSAVGFVAVGPAIGATTIWLERPPTGLATVVLLSYVFGGVPALIAGVAYGLVRASAHISTPRWYTRAFLGAAAGLFGSLLFFLLVSAYDLLTIPERRLYDVQIGFLRRLVLAGIPAGAICALLLDVVKPITAIRVSRA
jgi:hypothetical protein